MKNGFKVFDTDTHVMPAAEVIERGSQRAMWVAPSSAGFSSLTRRQRTQFGPNSGLCGAPHKPDYAELSVMRSRVA